VKTPGAFVRLSLDSPGLTSISRCPAASSFITGSIFWPIRISASGTFRVPERRPAPAQKFYGERERRPGYHVTEIRTALFSDQSGQNRDPSSALENRRPRCRFLQSRRHVHFFFQRGAKEYALQTDPIELDVAPLPSALRPAGFSGGVGRVRLSSSLDKNKNVRGEPITLTVSVTGSGNIKSSGRPRFSGFQGFRKYDTASSLNIDKANDVSGAPKFTRSFSFPSLPAARLSPGHFQLFNLKEKNIRPWPPPH